MLRYLPFLGQSEVGTAQYGSTFRKNRFVKGAQLPNIGQHAKTGTIFFPAVHDNLRNSQALYSIREYEKMYLREAESEREVITPRRLGEGIRLSKFEVKPRNVEIESAPDMRKFHWQPRRFSVCCITMIKDGLVKAPNSSVLYPLINGFPKRRFSV